MKKTLIFLSVFALSCGKEQPLPVNNIAGEKSTSSRAGDSRKLKFMFSAKVNHNIHAGIGNMTQTDLTPLTQLCCDGQPTIEFDYFYGPMPFGAHYVETYADTLIDYAKEMATIDVYGYNNIVNNCPAGLNIMYTGQNCIKEAKIKWGEDFIPVPNCHYVNMKLHIFDGVADTLYVQIFKDQPVTMTFTKYWK